MTKLFSAMLILLVIPNVISLGGFVLDEQLEFIPPRSMNGLQVNLDWMGVCDAKRYFNMQYDYPALTTPFMNPTASVCDMCPQSGINGQASITYQSSTDWHDDCTGYDCSMYYGPSGTYGPTSTEYCYRRSAEPSGDHICNNGGGACVSRDAACNANALSSSLQTSCGTCAYLTGCTGATPGSCASFAAGTDSGACKECNGAGGEQTPADDGDCGIIDCDGKDYYYSAGTEGAMTTETCFFHDYSDISTTRCEGFGDCKDANTADCDGYAVLDPEQYSCGTCQYLAAGQCTGTIRGSCSNYITGTVCSAPMDCDFKDGYEITGTQGASTTSSCVYNNYVDTAQKCNGAGSCSALDCGAPAVTTYATAYACSYISRCDSGGQTVGSYTSWEVCGTNMRCNTAGTCVNCDVNYDKSCGSCGGKIKCNGDCSVDTPANYNNDCGSCGGKITCAGTCSVATPANYGQACNCGGTYGCAGTCSTAACTSPDTCVNGVCTCTPTYTQSDCALYNVCGVLPDDGCGDPITCTCSSGNCCAGTCCQSSLDDCIDGVCVPWGGGYN